MYMAFPLLLLGMLTARLYQRFIFFFVMIVNKSVCLLEIVNYLFYSRELSLRYLTNKAKVV